MAEVGPVIPFKINTFSDGTDTYPDLRSIRWQGNPLPTFKRRAEGSLRPTAMYPVGSNQAPYSGTITGSSASLRALAGTTKAACTIAATNAEGNAACTIDLTNVTFGGWSGGADENSTEETPQSITFEATDIEVSNDA